MNKKELIMAIIDLVDKNEKLKIENEILLKQKTITVENQLTETQLKVLVLSESKLLREHFSSWSKEIRATENDDGVILYTPYENWVYKKVHSVPNNFSKKEFIEYFDKELRELYSKELNEVMNEEN